MRRGTLLLEVVLALAVFVAAGLVILSLVGQAGDSLAALRQQVRAADLARSAMARIEAGIGDPVAMNGPVTWWEEEGGVNARDDRPVASAGTGGWELRIETEPAEFAGLTRVSVTAIRAGGTAGSASFTLHQLVRLGRRGEDIAGPGGESATRSSEVAP